MLLLNKLTYNFYPTTNILHLTFLLMYFLFLKKSSVPSPLGIHSFQGLGGGGGVHNNMIALIF